MVATPSSDTHCDHGKKITIATVIHNNVLINYHYRLVNYVAPRLTSFPDRGRRNEDLIYYRFDKSDSG